MHLSGDRRGLWRAGIVQILGLLIYVAVAEIVVSTLGRRLGSELLPIVGIVLALIPAGLWMAFFYAQDRLEPEPCHYVVLVAALGALVAVVGQWIIQGLFRVQDWMGHDRTTEILASILVIGFVQEFMKYAAVRSSVYYSSEFDARIDGIVYGTAAGLGYATYLNIATVFGGGGITTTELTALVVRMVVVALSQASFGGIVGYFIARTKFDDEPAWWMPTGLALAACLNGGFSWLRGEITQAPLTLSASGVHVAGHNPWPALVLASCVALVLLGLTFTLMRRANRLTLAGADSDSQ
jgi:protease PrsW